MVKGKKTWIPKFAAMVCGVLVLGSMALAGHFARQKTEKPESDSTVAVTADDTKPRTVSLVAAGDYMLSDTMIQAALKADRTYDFSTIFTEVKKMVSDADLAVLNQETILGGEQFDYSGYPLYNSPWEAGDAAVQAGFDVFLCANNHAMDMGVQGIENAIAYFNQKKGVTYLGIHRDAASYQSIRILEKNGIRIAMLNYTFGTNGIDLPEDKPWLINLMDKEKMAQDIATAKKQADVVIVFPHWGTSYATDVSTAQEDLARFFCESGVHLVIGSHPHVLGPVQWLTSDTGNKTLVYYSLGNFMAHQNGMDRMLGALADVTITKVNGQVTVEGKAVPLVNHIVKTEEKWAFKVYPLAAYTQALANAHKEANLTLPYLNEQAFALLGEFQELKK